MPILADLILYNAKVTTLDPVNPSASAIAIADGRFLAVGSEDDVLVHRGENTKLVDCNRRRLIPGLIDSHIHVIRGGLNFNMELRWDGVPSLSDAMAMLREQVARTPAPQWVRVIGGFNEYQFAEKRLPTIEELNAAAPDTPVFILHLYDRALLNGAALRAVGYDRTTPNPPGGLILKDSRGEPTGLLLAEPNAMLLYSALAKGPKLPYEYQVNSTRHFMRDLNRLGVTSVIDAGGGFQNYPDDYQVIEDLHKSGEMTLRIAYNLFTQRPKEELSDFAGWTKSVKVGQGDDFYRHNGAGEMLVFSAADFEDFRQPQPTLAPGMEDELEQVVRLLVEHRWPFRLHATYDESISRMLDVFEKVNQDIPFDGLHWFFDHAETVSDKNINRIAKLGGGIAIQHRMAYQGEYFVQRYGAEAVKRTPPFKRMIEMGVQVGAGTDATRVASYDPWTALYWLSTGKTVGGMSMYPGENLVDRETALRLYTQGNTWFSNEEGLKGQIKVGQYADAVLLSDDFFAIPDEEIRNLVSVMTIVAGKVVYSDDEFSLMSPKLPPAMPDWSPANYYQGYFKPTHNVQHAMAHAGCGCGTECNVHGHSHARASSAAISDDQQNGFWGALGCSCWAF
ncbi:amidohydrolase [Marinomonas lutimaris]|uniref:amidohydrolase n=1 Tax=Marinomonas lutimaris TaxID=2846746 RepID=UPI001C67F673|nr:amidohydrolase [Marinomonas lutimaris]